MLTGLARNAIARALGRPERPLPAEGLGAWLEQPAATFVSLHRDGVLRGCIGTLEPVRPLAEDIQANALAAAFRDPRVPPVVPEELDDLEVEVSVLGPPEPLPRARTLAEAASLLRPGRDGVILHAAGRRAVFLPQVWEDLPDPVTFLVHLRRKAGLPGHGWEPDARLQRFSVTAYVDPPRGDR